MMDSIALNAPQQFALHSTNWRLLGYGRKWNQPPSSLSCFLPSFPQKSRPRTNSSVRAAARKNNRTKREDSHSIVPRADEATGPFPEAVLLKERKLEEDGMLLPEFADEEERELFEALNLQLESDMDVERMRHYEVVYLIHEDYKDEVDNVNTKVQEFLKEKKGKLWRLSDWGVRRLAYKIRKAKNAHYILMNFELEAQWINDFKSLLDQDERVIRHLVMKQDKAETEECPPPPEFPSLRAGMSDDDEEEDEEWVDDDEDGVILVDDDEDDEIENDNDRALSKSLKTSKAKSVRVG